MVLGFLILGPTFDIWAENDSTKVWDRVKVFLSTSWNIPVLLLFLSLSLFLASIYHTGLVIHSYKRSLDEDINNYGKVLLRKYRELLKFSSDKALDKEIKKFTNQIDYVEGVQLYKYTAIPKSSDVLINVEYSNGYVKETLSVNGLIRHYFEVDRKVYTDYLKVTEGIMTNPNKSNISNAISFLYGYSEQLKEKKESELAGHDGLIYALLLDLLNTLKLKFEDTVTPNFFEDCPEIEEKLKRINEKQRIGILRGILLRHPFMFRYEKDILNDKEGRTYLTNITSLEGSNYLYLIHLDTNLMEIISEEKLLETYRELTSNLGELLHQTVEKVYNSKEEVVSNE